MIEKDRLICLIKNADNTGIIESINKETFNDFVESVAYEINKECQTIYNKQMFELKEAFKNYREVILSIGDNYEHFSIEHLEKLKPAIDLLGLKVEISIK